MVKIKNSLTKTFFYFNKGQFNTCKNIDIDITSGLTAECICFDLGVQ